MNLCWLVPNDHAGGIISVAVSCCRQAAAAGHDVTLLLLTEPEGHFDEYATFCYESLGLPAKSPSAPQALVDWLKQNSQDVLFINDCSPSHAALPHIPNGTRSVFVVHDTARQYWGPAARAESSLDAIVTVSDVIARQFRGELDAPEKLHVLHNGTIFPEDVSPRPSHERNPDLLFLGGDKPFKGADDVLNLWPKLVTGGFEGRLFWYGGVEPTFASRIEALPHADRIFTPGRVPRSVIFERAARANAILVPSRVESFGMVTVEGMGMGSVPIAWDIETGTREIVSPGKDGLLVPLGNTDAMADAVFEILASHERFATQAIEKARTRFSEAAMWRRYADFLDILQAQPPVHRPEAGSSPPGYEPPRRYFQLLPESLRSSLRDAVARSPKLSYWLRDWRGL
jgi:glycosyltransferase involved in cell wall biosynthesis